MDLLAANADFRRLWIAQTISLIGSQITYLAIPLIAAVTLHATPIEMGVLVALEALPALFFGLIAGAIVDRSPKRRILISSDLARAAVLLLLPAAAVTGNLSMPFLFGAAFAVGAATLFFDSANQALIPRLLGGDDLLKGNSALEVSRSAGELVGPAISGLLIQIIKAPFALLIDAVSFLLSACFVARISDRETGTLTTDGETLGESVRDGVRMIVQNQQVRILAICAAALGLTNAMVEAVVLLYLVRDVGLEPAIIGFVFAAGSVGFIVGAVIPSHIVARVGVGPAMAIALALIGVGDLLIPLAGSQVVWAVLMVGLGQFLFGIGLTLFNVTQLTIRQSLVPIQLAGRIASNLRTLGWGLAPIGALIGGILAQATDLRTTLVIAATLEAAIAIGIWRSRLWSFHTLPTQSGAAG